MTRSHKNASRRHCFASVRSQRVTSCHVHCILVMRTLASTTCGASTLPVGNNLTVRSGAFGLSIIVRALPQTDIAYPLKAKVVWQELLLRPGPLTHRYDITFFQTSC
uniref:PilZ domain-containing protein n=1 Tax=Steinernema glaseri TaxID=37863 RepID=A0A1I7Y223_9BILA